ncbi:MAG: DUF2933 domain-containing protein [Betaproteobacteria bacterium]|nr:DUF2933 domain-containing protein [Betaproteobacteria bacterium]
MQALDENMKKCFWMSCTGAVLIAFTAVAGVFLFAEHRARLWEFAPYLLLLACPLMHLFGHGGHGANGGHTQGAGRQAGVGRRKEGND